MLGEISKNYCAICTNFKNLFHAQIYPRTALICLAIHLFIFFKFAGAHTQHIERVWREVRGNIPRYGRRTDHVVGYLSEFLFKRAYSRLERIEIFFDIIAEMYPPPLTLEMQPERSCDEPSTSTA